jgi:DNA-directed RNA polymerase specialized sigma24 family protein
MTYPSDRQFAQRRRATKRPEVFRIEGETLTYAEIGARLGISDRAAARRMQKLFGASGPLNWERLRALAA